MKVYIGSDGTVLQGRPDFGGESSGGAGVATDIEKSDLENWEKQKQKQQEEQKKKDDIRKQIAEINKLIDGSSNDTLKNSLEQIKNKL